MKQRVFLILVSAVLMFSVGQADTRAQQGSGSTDYSDVRIEKFPVAVQCWTYRAFTFRETLEKVQALGISYIQPYPGQRLSEETGDARFDHNMTDEQIRQARIWMNEAGIEAVAYGVVGIPSEEEGARQVFQFARRMRIRTIVSEPEFDNFPLIDRLVKETGVRVAVHNHPTPNRYAQPQTVLDQVDGLDPRIGACPDTGHWLRSGVTPVEALRLLEGRIIDVHLKDLDQAGVREALDVPFGSGMANVRDILAELTLQEFDGYITIEHEHPDEVRTPEAAILKGLEYIRSVTYWHDYERILRKTPRGYRKDGWNHYGPGLFELDREKGELSATGGMGLFWYSRQMYRDFVLEFEYRCNEPQTNSGIFVRVPDIPVDDSYIYHSFEIQIADNGEGIHATGAVYDAEPPTSLPVKPAGEWNQMKIAMTGNHIRVDVNGEQVIDWEMEPRGKVRDIAPEGYIGFQGHDWDTTIGFRNIRIKEIHNVPPEGFTALFNGEDLTGWKGLVADPPARAQMNADELAAAQAIADEDMREHWSVEKGVLVFDGAGHSLCTAKDYGDFEMMVDYRILPEGDSGIYLRGSPQVQIWDTAMWPQGSGGLYNNQKNPSNPLVVADRPVGTWNSLYIKMIGEKVTVRLNNLLVVDNVVMENYWERDIPIYPTGQIELQSHGNSLYFRNIYIREIEP
ncbi:family 16 glycoside hydrolase [Gemmatimonadota bacterium]